MPSVKTFEITSVTLSHRYEQSQARTAISGLEISQTRGSSDIASESRVGGPTMHNELFPELYAFFNAGPVMIDTRVVLVDSQSSFKQNKNSTFFNEKKRLGTCISKVVHTYINSESY